MLFEKKVSENSRAICFGEIALDFKKNGRINYFTKDEFLIEPRYAHKKNLTNQRKKIISWKRIILEH